MNIIITGGVGFIGTNCVIGFMKESAFNNITIIDNFSRKGVLVNAQYIQKQYPKVHIIQTDIADTRKYLRILNKADVVIHLAGQTAVTTSLRHPDQDFANNLAGGFALLDALRRHNPQAIFLYASTNKVYGDLHHHQVVKNIKKKKYENNTCPNGVTEQEPLEFISPYGCSKGAMDQYVHDYAAMYGLKTIVFRQSCIYGEFQMGVEDQGWVAHFSRQFLHHKPITIFGDGYQVRDLLWVEDLIKAYMRSITLIQKTQGAIYNIGGGIKNAYSLIQVLDMLKRVTNHTIPIHFSENRTGDQKWFISANTRLYKDIGWKPTTTLEIGLNTLVNWQKQFLI